MLYCLTPSVENNIDRIPKGFLGNTTNKKRGFNLAYLDYDDLGNLICIDEIFKIDPDIRPAQALKKEFLLGPSGKILQTLWVRILFQTSSQSLWD